MSELIVSTDLQDYAPGSTALITASGFAPGSTVMFEVSHADGNESGAGHDPWYVVDGGVGDLDGVVNGSISTRWYVNPDDSLGSSFVLTAATAGADGAFGTGDDLVGTTTFTDAIITPVAGVSVTHDESAGLQNFSVLGAPAGDANDNEVTLALPLAFSTGVATLLSATAATEVLIGAALRTATRRRAASHFSIWIEGISEDETRWRITSGQISEWQITIPHCGKPVATY